MEEIKQEAIPKMEEVSKNEAPSIYAKSFNAMIGINDNSFNDSYFKTDRFLRKFDYTLEDVMSIVTSGNTTAKKNLSRWAYTSDGIYKQLIMHYATLLTFNHLLIPNPNFGVSLQQKSFAKKYYAAMAFVDKLGLKETGQRIAERVLEDGTYYGAILTMTKSDLTILDLPFDYCRNRFKDINGSPIVEFNVTFFDKILVDKDREAALKSYPSVIAKYYRKWKKHSSVGEWVFIPTDIGLCFNLFDDVPYFVNTIPALLRYGHTVDNEQIKELEHIKKILVQEMPHLNDGSLVFEPDEALEMHNGTVGMLKRSNPYTSVLTTYGKVSLYDAKTTDSVTNNTLENMRKHTYAVAGVSPDLFAASGSSALPSSIKEDISIMMVLATKIANYITNIVNKLFGNNSLNYKLIILPVSIHNQADMIDEYFKLASSGYSHLLPAVAGGLSVKELIDIKTLENDVLQLSKKLIPLSSAYTQSANKPTGDEKEDSGEEDDGTPAKEVPVKENDPNADEGGRPEKKDGERADKTEANRDSKAKN